MGLKFIKKNKELSDNNPYIKDQINNSKKFDKGLEKIIV